MSNHSGGDDEHPEESPQDFLKVMQCWGLNKTNAMDTQKLENFGLNLKLNTAAEQWFDNLPTTDIDTWDHLVSAFKRKWPSKVPTMKTVEEKQAALEQTTISEEEVGKRVVTNRVEELVHVVWADKIECLAAAIPDANGLLVNSIRRSMPKVLQKVTGSGHTTWASFCNAVCAATVTQIAEAKEEEKEARELQEQVKKLQELCKTSVTPNYSPTPTLNANNQAPRTTYQTLNQPTYQQNRTPAKRMNNVIRLALPIHPNTPAGWPLYEAQITKWHTEYTGQQVSKTCPYPLSPGTMPVVSGECWGCGLSGHMGPSCNSSTPVPRSESRWRSIAASIKHSCTPNVTRNVNLINEISPWASREEYDQQVITNYLASQGKGPGSSA
ncbi:hypothetical protein L208DRAFT_1327943 [Tricholoma matsutake]|nr:hypothetical protein L208DRAFT_1327943 [Tricholoma matsutake 945]